MSFPSSIDSFAGFTGSDTLAADNHAAQENQQEVAIVAVETKIGTGAATPTIATVLRGSGTGTSAWSSVNATTDISGVLAQSNGGTGQTSGTGTGIPVYQTSPSITTPTVSGGIFSGNPNFTGQPTITDFTNANHNHQNTAGAGVLNAGLALSPGSILQTTLGTDSSWSTKPYSPTLTNLTLGNGSQIAQYFQYGKFVYVAYKFTLGSTSSVGTNPNISFPVTAASYYGSNDMLGQGIAFTSGQWLVGAFWVNSTTFRPLLWSATGTYVSGITTVTASVPATWGIGDTFQLIFTYEAA